jgi:hypothetical protein
LPFDLIEKAGDTGPTKQPLEGTLSVIVEGIGKARFCGVLDSR